jgi:hypothetical protein
MRWLFLLFLLSGCTYELDAVKECGYICEDHCPTPWFKDHMLCAPTRIDIEDTGDYRCFCKFDASFVM